jgi:hypothetical protein
MFAFRRLLVVGDEEVTICPLFALFCLLHSVYAFSSPHAPISLFNFLFFLLFPSIHELYDYLRRPIDA